MVLNVCVMCTIMVVANILITLEMTSFTGGNRRQGECEFKPCQLVSSKDSFDVKVQQPVPWTQQIGKLFKKMLKT